MGVLDTLSAASKPRRQQRRFKVAIMANSGIKPETGLGVQRLDDKYLTAAMRICNALPIIVPTLFSAEELDDVLSLVDGVILTGDQSNVAPDLYGVCDPAGRFGPFDPRRDTAALYLAKEAMRREIPFFLASVGECKKSMSPLAGH